MMEFVVFFDFFFFPFCFKYHKNRSELPDLFFCALRSLLQVSTQLDCSPYSGLAGEGHVHEVPNEGDERSKKIGR